MPNSEFLIQIKTALEGTGIKATDEQLSAFNDNLGKTNQSLGEVAAKGEESGERMAKGAHHAELSHHELKESIRAVSQQFGGLADVGLWLKLKLPSLSA